MKPALPAGDIVVRRLGVDDAPRYRTLRLAGLRDFPHAFRPDYEEALAEPLSWSEQRLAAPGEYWFGAFDGAQLVGAVGLHTQQGKKVRHAATLRGLVVETNRQAQGIGGKLVAHLIGFAGSLGHIRQIQLTVSEGNAHAERLYDAFGFEQFGLEHDAFLHDGQYYAKQHRQLILESHIHE
jgi:ribosomal protein S18 acetylase RimI-like enzyme